MSEVSKQEVIAYLSALRPAELQDLILDLEDVWGIERLASPDQFVIMGTVEMGMPAGFEVVLRGVDGSRIGLMKALRECFGLSLRVAKDMVDGAGELVIAVDLNKPEADGLAKRLRAAGAVIEIRSCEGL